MSWTKKVRTLHEQVGHAIVPFVSIEKEAASLSTFLSNANSFFFQHNPARVLNCPARGTPVI
jgi:hypothetical protein